MIKLMKKYTEVSMILFSLLLLQISNLFQWDSNPIMGIDKACADIIIVVLCCILIKKLGIQSGAGFTKSGFGKGILYGIPFFVIGIQHKTTIIISAQALSIPIIGLLSH